MGNTWSGDHWHVRDRPRRDGGQIIGLLSEGAVITVSEHLGDDWVLIEEPVEFAGNTLRLRDGDENTREGRRYWTRVGASTTNGTDNGPDISVLGRTLLMSSLSGTERREAAAAMRREVPPPPPLETRRASESDGDTGSRSSPWFRRPSFEKIRRKSHTCEQS